MKLVHEGIEHLHTAGALQVGIDRSTHRYVLAIGSSSAELSAESLTALGVVLIRMSGTDYDFTQELPGLPDLSKENEETG